MRVFVDSSVCRGHGVCVYLVPEVFSFGERGQVEILAQPGEERRDQVTEAARACPEGAIALID